MPSITEGVLEVKSFLVGETGVVARLDIPLVHKIDLRLVTWIHQKIHGPLREGYRVSWKQMDLSDPEHPRTTVPRDKLKERS